MCGKWLIFFFFLRKQYFFLAHVSSLLHRGCVTSPLEWCVPTGNCWGHVSLGKGHARLVGSAKLPLSAWSLQGKPIASPPWESCQGWELAGFASQQVGRLVSPRGIRASQVGSGCRISGCGVIKTCKVFPSSPLGREAWSLGQAHGGAACAAVALLAPGHCPLGFTPWLQFYPSQICSPGWRQVPVQCRWLKPL